MGRRQRTCGNVQVGNVPADTLLKASGQVGFERLLIDYYIYKPQQ